MKKTFGELLQLARTVESEPAAEEYRRQNLCDYGNLLEDAVNEHLLDCRECYRDYIESQP